VARAEKTKGRGPCVSCSPEMARKRAAKEGATTSLTVLPERAAKRRLEAAERLSAGGGGGEGPAEDLARGEKRGGGRE